MYFVYRDGKYTDCAGQSFRDFMAGKLPTLPGAVPTMADWANHLTTLFPDVRLKKVIEMRGADMGSREMLMALPAFWAGLLYDAAAREAAWALAKDWSAEDRARLRDEVPRRGFEADIGGRKLLEVARDAVTLAQQGLRRRAALSHGADETRYLDALFEVSESGQSRADRFLAQAGSLKNFTIRDVFETARLLPATARP